MNEKKEISAKDLYIWSKGEDEYGIKVLSVLNKIIDGLKELGECGEWQDIAERVDWHSSSCRIAENCDKLYSKDELFDMVDNFETVRKLLFGDKIDYIKLLEMLKNNVDECGWTEEKAKKRKEENREKLEEKRRKENVQPDKPASETLSAESLPDSDNWSERMPERIKKQLEKYKEEAGGTFDERK